MREEGRVKHQQTQLEKRGNERGEQKGTEKRREHTFSGSKMKQDTGTVKHWQMGVEIGQMMTKE